MARAGDSELDGIMAVKDEHGRTVYVNAPSPKPKRSVSASRRSSVLVYWSNKEKRWKPVPPPTPSAMRAARSAAEEVSEFIAKASPAARLKAGNGSPNNFNLLGGREVTTQEIDAAIQQAAARHRVDPNLVRAIIKVESDFNPRAVSSKGAMGLMQLMPDTARQLNVNHPFDPQENVDAGVRHLKTLLDNFGGNVDLSLAAYNAGESAVTRHNSVPDYAETRNYVKQITSMYWNGQPIGPGTPRPRPSPVRIFRGPDGVLTMTNE